MYKARSKLLNLIRPMSHKVREQQRNTYKRQSFIHSQNTTSWHHKNA